jgi:hypothetical protein
MSPGMIPRMNGLRRKLILGATILSAIFFALTISLWIRSYWYYDSVALRGPEVYRLELINGTFSFTRQIDYPIVYTIQKNGRLNFLRFGPAKSVQNFWQLLHTYQPAMNQMHSSWWFHHWTLGYLRSTSFSLSFSSTPIVTPIVGVDEMGTGWMFPAWFVVLLTALLPGYRILLAGRRTKAQKRMSLNQCVHCGYDLRATPDRCPECGTIPAKTNFSSL